MAHVFGEPSRNAAEKSYNETKKLLIVAFSAIASLSLIAGYAFGARFPFRTLPIRAVFCIIVLLWLAAIFVGKWGLRKIDAIDRERMSWRKGATGEALVAQVLKTLPPEFVVINDVTKRFGNIDHVVIGPTGIYVIDAKNWRGTVSSDGNGELLLNGKALEKPIVKMALRATMDFQNKLKTLVDREHFVRGLLVFPIAYVEANFGSTKQIHCLREDRLIEYIQNQAFSNKLDDNDIQRIKRATLQLAQMDEYFR